MVITLLYYPERLVGSIAAPVHSPFFSVVVFAVRETIYVVLVQL